MFAVIASLALSLLATVADGSSAVALYPSLVRVQKEYAAMRSAKNPRAKAEHAYLLNDAADRYTYRLNKAAGRFKQDGPDLRVLKQNTSAQVEEANRYGASILWCEPNGDWTTLSDGYRTYLSQWPKGPYAEEAWWRGRVVHPCYDGEGSEEETRAFFNAYSDFLKHFPHGRHEAEARKLLKSFESDLASYKTR